MIILDWISTIFQSLIFSYVLCYCIDKKQGISKVKMFFMTIMFTIVGTAFTGTFLDNPGISVILTHILSLLLVAILYRKDLTNGLVAYTIIYCILGICSIIFGNIIFAYVEEFLSIKYLNYEELFIVYVPQLVIIFSCFRYIEKIRQVYKLIEGEKGSIYLIIFSFAIDFVITFYMLSLGYKSQLLKNLVYIIFFLFFMLVLFYFWKISNKSQQISKLNENLEIKNNELRKVKHDYGAQISYLYGLCLMERYSDLKKSLKDIIDINEAIPTAAEVTKDRDSLLSLALKPAIDKGIHVVIEEACDYNLINMKEMELYRIISNIVNNAIYAMKGEGIIIAKSYEYLGSLVIKIENNGPKIEEDTFKNIFKAGFTTKENSDKNHGYGLSIVKEIVESYNGKIRVKSTNISTEFRIVLPIK